MRLPEGDICKVDRVRLELHCKKQMLLASLTLLTDLFQINKWLQSENPATLPSLDPTILSVAVD